MKNNLFSCGIILTSIIAATVRVINIPIDFLNIASLIIHSIVTCAAGGANGGRSGDKNTAVRNIRNRLLDSV